MIKYAEKHASRLGDNHAQRALAVNEAIQRVTTMEDFIKILQNQKDLLEKKQITENIEHLLDKRYSAKISNPSKLNVFNAPYVRLDVLESKEPTTYHELIIKNYELATQLIDKIAPIVRYFG